MAFMQKTEGFRVRLRPATLDDCRLVWEWANDPVVRAASFNPNPIPWDQHKEWFRKKLGDSSCLYYIVLNDLGLPIGQVRFDTAGNEAEINISISPSFRGHGFGAKAIQMASERLFCETGVIRINAHIKQGNETSVRTFAKANYKDMGIKVAMGQQALQMVLDKNDGLSRKSYLQDQ
jgi:RimJ/RimL family protein N-acetyltransferase